MDTEVINLDQDTDRDRMIEMQEDQNQQNGEVDDRENLTNQLKELRGQLRRKKIMGKTVIVRPEI